MEKSELTLLEGVKLYNMKIIICHMLDRQFAEENKLPKPERYEKQPQPKQDKYRGWLYQCMLTVWKTSKIK